MSAALTIVAGNLPWSTQWQTPHYVSELLAQDRKVLYVEPALTWNPADTQTSARRVWQCGTCRQVRDAIWTVIPPAMPFGRIGWIKPINEKIFRRAMCQVLGNFAPAEVHLWICATGHGPALRRLFPDAHCVFHAIDVFTRREDRLAASLLAQHADVVFCSSPAIAREMQLHNSRIALFPNGWNFSDSEQNSPEHALLAGLPRPRIGLVGFLSANLDYELLRKIALACSAPLVIVGGRAGDLSATDRSALRSLHKIKNVYFLGAQPVSLLPSFIKGFDICLAPYKNNARILGSNPLKVYQYLAMGKPVVSSDVEILRGLEPMVHVSNSHTEFIEAVSAEMADSTEEALRQQRLEFAKSTTWASRWEAVKKLMSEQTWFIGENRAKA